MTKNRFSVYKGLALISQIGLQMVIPIALSVILGGYLNRRFHINSFIIMILIIIGVVVGFLNVYKIVMNDLKKKEK